MVITELYIRNFGKLSENHFYLRDGVQVISGENEYGKTTLHAFIRAMFFGLERGRGRAAAKDDFSRYEPWDNPEAMRELCGLPAADAAFGWKEILPVRQSRYHWYARMTEKNCR